MKDIYTRNESFVFKGFRFNLEKANLNKLSVNEIIQYHNLDLIDYDIDVFVVCDNEQIEDSYKLEIKYNKQVFITVSSLRTFDYAIRDLKASIFTKDFKKRLRIQTIIDKPDFKIRGIIEGFYGKPYDFNIRKDIIDFSKTYKLNSYLYAPKDDLYHRENWRLLYPKEALSVLETLSGYAKKQMVDFYYCISPGLDFDYDNELDYQTLFHKIDQLKSINIGYFALLMDDLPIQNDKNVDLYDLARKHAVLANKLSTHLNGQPILFCPTDYFQNTNTPYREAIKTHLDSHIIVFWTGYNTVAEKIDEKESLDVQTYFGHELLLWDNYPVNDFKPKERIYLGPIINRSKNLSKHHVGYVANPSSNWYLSKMPLVSIARYIDDVTTYDINLIKQDMVRLFSSNEIVQRAFLNLIKYNETSVLGLSNYDIMMKSFYENKDFESLDKVYNEIKETCQILEVFNHNPLQEELKPYLEYMTNEIKLYNQLKENKVDETLFSNMFKSTHKTSNQEILKYIIKHQFVKGDYEFEDERTNFWSYQDQNN